MSLYIFCKARLILRPNRKVAARISNGDTADTHTCKFNAALIDFDK